MLRADNTGLDPGLFLGRGGGVAPLRDDETDCFKSEYEEGFLTRQ